MDEATRKLDLSRQAKRIFICNPEMTGRELRGLRDVVDACSKVEGPLEVAVSDGKGFVARASSRTRRAFN